jgi:hypothetical protein
VEEVESVSEGGGGGGGGRCGGGGGCAGKETREDKLTNSPPQTGSKQRAASSSSSSSSSSSVTYSETLRRGKQASKQADFRATATGSGNARSNQKPRSQKLAVIADDGASRFGAFSWH